jgi:hypothetical protein
LTRTSELRKVEYRRSRISGLVTRKFGIMKFMLLTPGAGDMRIEQLTYVRRRKPVFPFEQDTAFDPARAPL